jgi:UDP-hydrolysing UDP-N-acetyl-D-glucosamine 2-epimerase
LKRTIAVVTSSRADYSHLYWPLHDLAAHPDVHLRLIVMASHLSPEFGLTVREIENDGLSIAVRIECLMSSDTDVGMAKTIGVATLSLADTLARIRPDLLLLIADRYEMLAPACVALALRIPIAHIEGGEISEGAIDDMVRNALTKMSHLHFTSTETARSRVIGMGEEPWRVHRAGAPSLDHLTRGTLLDKAALESRLDVSLAQAPVIVAYHPVTILRDTTQESDALFQALKTISGPVYFCYPNADAGSYRLMEQTSTFIEQHPQSRVFVNLGAPVYWSLLRHAAMLIGNSSSGIMETASFALPTVNIGIRQRGRERAMNVIDAEPEAAAIIAAISKAQGDTFRNSLCGMSNPYGDGHASEKIVEVLTTAPLQQELLIKRGDPLAQ